MTNTTLAALARRLPNLCEDTWVALMCALAGLVAGTIIIWLVFLAVPFLVIAWRSEVYCRRYCR